MMLRKQDYENPKIRIFEFKEDLVRTSYQTYTTEDIYDDGFYDGNLKSN